MHAVVEPGKYVVAVSGGVDSVALLHMLTQSANQLELVVAHFDHGIRPDSASDAKFVANLADYYRVPYKTERAELGSSASEATARQARYDFLRRAKKQVGAQAIITAHHQDDLLETAILNMLRGTGRRGMTALQSTPSIARPLLGMPKTDITEYAVQHNLDWREDSTNQDERYTRNYVRNRLLTRFDTDARRQLLAIINRLQAVNDELDAELTSIVDDILARHFFNQLPHELAKEVLATWLRRHGIIDYDRKMLERLSVQAKTKPAGKQLDVKDGTRIILLPDRLTLRKSGR